MRIGCRPFLELYDPSFFLTVSTKSNTVLTYSKIENSLRLYNNDSFDVSPFVDEDRFGNVSIRKSVRLQVKYTSTHDSGLIKGCTEGVAADDNTCIWLNAEPMTWHQAEMKCSQSSPGGHLVAVTNPTIQQVVDAVISNRYLMSTGLRRVSQSLFSTLLLIVVVCSFPSIYESIQQKLFHVVPVDGAVPGCSIHVRPQQIETLPRVHHRALLPFPKKNVSHCHCAFLKFKLTQTEKYPWLQYRPHCQ